MLSVLPDLDICNHVSVHLQTSMNSFSLDVFSKHMGSYTETRVFCSAAVDNDNIAVVAKRPSATHYASLATLADVDLHAEETGKAKRAHGIADA